METNPRFSALVVAITQWLTKRRASPNQKLLGFMRTSKFDPGLFISQTSPQSRLERGVFLPRSYPSLRSSAYLLSEQILGF